MIPRTNTKIASGGENIFKVWERVKKYISDKDVLYDFDADLEDMDEEEADKYFGDEIIDYLNEEIAPLGTLFGINADTGDIGFWEEDLIDDGEDDDDEDREFNPEEDDDGYDLSEEEEEGTEGRIRTPEEFSARTPEERIDEILAEAEMEESSQESEGIEGGEKEGVAEVLDESGEVIATTEFTRNPSYTDMDLQSKLEFWKNRLRELQGSTDPQAKTKIEIVKRKIEQIDEKLEKLEDDR